MEDWQDEAFQEDPAQSMISLQKPLPADGLVKLDTPKAFIFNISPVDWLAIKPEDISSNTAACKSKIQKLKNNWCEIYNTAL